MSEHAIVSFFRGAAVCWIKLTCAGLRRCVVLVPLVGFYVFSSNTLQLYLVCLVCLSLVRRVLLHHTVVVLSFYGP